MTGIRVSSRLCGPLETWPCLQKEKEPVYYRVSKPIARRQKGIIYHCLLISCSIDGFELYNLILGNRNSRRMKKKNQTPWKKGGHWENRPLPVYYPRSPRAWNPGYFPTNNHNVWNIELKPTGTLGENPMFLSLSKSRQQGSFVGEHSLIRRFFIVLRVASPKIKLVSLGRRFSISEFWIRSASSKI